MVLKKNSEEVETLTDLDVRVNHKPLVPETGISGANINKQRKRTEYTACLLDPEIDSHKYRQFMAKVSLGKELSLQWLALGQLNIYLKKKVLTLIDGAYNKLFMTGYGFKPCTMKQ